MKLRVLSVAELEIAEAAIWYDDRQPALGDRFLDEVAGAYEQITAAPHECRRLEAYRGKREIRRCLLAHFPYVVIFTCGTEELLVVAVAHVRRRPFYWLSRIE